MTSRADRAEFSASSRRDGDRASRAVAVENAADRHIDAAHATNAEVAMTPARGGLRRSPHDMRRRGASPTCLDKGFVRSGSRADAVTRTLRTGQRPGHQQRLPSGHAPPEGRPVSAPRRRRRRAHDQPKPGLRAGPSPELPAIQVGGRGQWRVERVKLEEYIARLYKEPETSAPYGYDER